ncbi:MAG: acyltransferase [Pirellulaceae bacterium]
MPPTETTNTASHLAYRADVDGLRAIAVMLVVLFHVGWGWSGGYVGVDVFFVISGYLITSLIWKQQQAGTFRLAQFWHRRICRIVPAASVVAAATLIAGWFLLLPHDYHMLGMSAIAQQLMVSNAFFWFTTGYFDGPSELMPLLHTWSLAVEEQFYLFYPLLLMLLRSQSRGRIIGVLGVLSLGSLVFAQVFLRVDPSMAFYSIPSRTWELMLGGIVALLGPASLDRRSGSRITSDAVDARAGRGARSCRDPGRRLVVHRRDAVPRLDGPGAMPRSRRVIGANHARITWVGRLLSLRPLVQIGLMSYSIYLWHWPRWRRGVTGWIPSPGISERRSSSRPSLWRISVGD